MYIENHNSFWKRELCGVNPGELFYFADDLNDLYLMLEYTDYNGKYSCLIHNINENITNNYEDFEPDEEVLVCKKIKFTVK